MARKSSLIDRWRAERLRKFKKRMTYKGKYLEAKSTIYKNSTSLLWVWEFSKKAVLICFSFYVITQIYSMVAMWRYMDFTCLSQLIDSAKELTRDCVFGYFIKSGLENIPKIYFAHKRKTSDEDENAVG